MDYAQILYRSLLSKIQREQAAAASQGGGTEEPTTPGGGTEEPSTPGGGTEEPSTPGSLTDEQIEQIITEEVNNNEMTQNLAQENKEALVTELYRALTQGGDILTATDTKITNLIINKMTRAQYESITPSITEMYYLTDDDIYQEKLTAGSNVQINNNVISATDTTYTAGSNVQITGNVISATDTTYTAGTNVSIENNVISAAGTTYTAGENVQIAGNVISATDTTYTAGTNVSIENNVISATGANYTAGDNVQISDQNVISATDTVYTAGSNVQISADNEISSTDTTYTAGTGMDITNEAVGIVQTPVEVENFEIIGEDATITNKEASGFTEDSYLFVENFPEFNPQARSWELTFAVTLNGEGEQPADGLFELTKYAQPVTTEIFQCIRVMKGVVIQITTEGPSPGSTSDVTLSTEASVELELNTKYYFRVTYSVDTSYRMYSTTTPEDETSWVLESSDPSPFPIYHQEEIPLCIGKTQLDMPFTGGSIGLDYFSLRYTDTNEYVYRAYGEDTTGIAKATNSLYGLVKPDGSTIKVNDGVISVDISQVQVISGGEIVPEE